MGPGNWQQAVITRSAQLQHFPGLWGRAALSQGLKGPGPDPGDIIFGVVIFRDRRRQGLAKKLLNLGVAEFQAQN